MEYLFERVDNSRLTVFRIFFGLLMTIESWGAIATGWVKETFVDTTFTFNFIGFDWTQVFIGETMYYVYVAMGFLGILIMLGAFYRMSIIAFCLLWSLTYFAQKSHYNNHYYLLVIVSFLLTLMPANNSLSLDANFNVKIKRNTVFRWNYIVFQLTIACVYIYAAIAKLTPGWTENHFLPIRLRTSAKWFTDKLGENVFSEFLSNPDLAQLLAYAGIGFDFLIVPLLLIKPTRKIAFFAALFFHIFNSITLHIGIFPYFALALCIFFFDSKEIRNWFLPFVKRDSIEDRETNYNAKPRLTVVFLTIFTLLMVFLPLRHHLIPQDVTWTEEGHRLSWRMMLRSKTGQGTFYVETPDGKQKRISMYDYLSRHQINDVKTKPDMMWQFAQKLKQEYKDKGISPIKVYLKNSKLRINDGPYHNFINPEADLANVKWSYFGHQDWILPQPKDYYKKAEAKSIK